MFLLLGLTVLTAWTIATNTSFHQLLDPSSPSQLRLGADLWLGDILRVENGLPDEDQRTFDSAQWKRSTHHRYEMLFELQQMNLVGKTHSYVRRLLGNPDDTGFGRDVQEYYDAGEIDHCSYRLEIDYRSGAVNGISLRNLNEFSVYPRSIILSQWRTNNAQWQDLAKEINENYYIVGAPVAVLSELSSQLSSNRSATKFVEVKGPPRMAFISEICRDFGSLSRMYGGKCQEPERLSIEYEAKDGKVSRFRLVLADIDKRGSLFFSDWQERDLRPDPRCLTTINDYRCLTDPALLLVIPNEPFDSGNWKEFRRGNWGASFGRAQSLCNLFHSHRTVGMSRSELYSLLGSPSDGSFNIQQDLCRKPTPTSDCVSYPVTAEGCLPLGVEWLQFVLEKDHVIAYRLVFGSCQYHGRN